MIEINAHPYRLDLDWRYVRKAIDMGIMLSINPDAHSLDDVENIRYGVGIARKGWLTKKDVINTWTVPRIRKLFEKRRK